jgi:hypothetical protein
MQIMRDDPPRRDARAAERRVVGILAQLREMGGGRMTVNVEDLSITGFRVESIYRIGVGVTVFLSIPTFSALEAIVVWTAKSGYGCQFIQPLHPAVFDVVSRRFEAHF